MNWDKTSIALARISLPWSKCCTDSFNMVQCDSVAIAMTVPIALLPVCNKRRKGADQEVFIKVELDGMKTRVATWDALVT